MGIFLSLNVPAGDGVGASLDVSQMAPNKCVIASIAQNAGEVIIEASANGVNFYGVLRLDVRATSKPIHMNVVARFMRVRRRFVSGGSLPVVTLGADLSTLNAFAALTVLGTDGAGPSIVSGNFGTRKTFSTGGVLTSGFVLVEGSQDGVNFQPVGRLNAPWDENNQQFLTMDCSYAALRISRFLTRQTDSPSVQLGHNSDEDIEGVPISADWDINTIRFYALDNDAGDDANLGYSDTSMALAGAVAKKTWNALVSIIPRVGAGRFMMIAIKNRANGANYLRTDGSNADLTFRGFVGYVAIHIVGTSDFTDSASDRIISGAVQAQVGPNIDGSWTVAAAPAPTVNAFSVAAGALTAEPALTGRRVRFKGNVTAALANRCAGIYLNSGTAITVMQDLNAVPVAGDEFFIEQPGVTFRFVIADSGSNLSVRGIGENSGVSNGWQVNSFPDNYNFYLMSFCEQRTVGGFPLFKNLSIFQTTETYAHLDGANSIVGTGFKTQGGIQVFNSQLCQVRCSVATNENNGQSAFRDIRDTRNFADSIGTIGEGCVFGNRVQIRNIGQNGTPLVATGLLGTPTFGQFTAGFRQARWWRAPPGGMALQLIETVLNLEGILFENMTVRAIEVLGNGCELRLSNISGATGNTGNILHLGTSQFGLQESSNCKILIGANMTVATTAAFDFITGDNVAGGKFVDLTITNLVDERGNSLMGSGGAIVGQGIRFINMSGSTLTIGEIIRSNGTNRQFTRAQANTAANAEGPLLVVLSTIGDTLEGYAHPLGQGSYVAFDAVPGINALAYLDDGTPGLATTVVPPVAGTNQKRRLGHTFQVNGQRARVAGSPELLPILSDGLVP